MIIPNYTLTIKIIHIYHVLMVPLEVYDVWQLFIFVSASYLNLLSFVV